MAPGQIPVLVEPGAWPNPGRTAELAAPAGRVAVRSLLGFAARTPIWQPVGIDQEGDPVWDVALGGRVGGIIRYGTSNAVWPEGWQFDIEGAGFPRLTLDENRDLISADFRFGTPLTYRRGVWEAKFGYYHLSSHLGDEFMLSHPGIERLNYVRDSLLLGWAISSQPRCSTLRPRQDGHSTPTAGLSRGSSVSDSSTAPGSRPACWGTVFRHQRSPARSQFRRQRRGAGGLAMAGSQWTPVFGLACITSTASRTNTSSIAGLKNNSASVCGTTSDSLPLSDGFTILCKLAKHGHLRLLFRFLPTRIPAWRPLDDPSVLRTCAYSSLLIGLGGVPAAADQTKKPASKAADDEDVYRLREAAGRHHRRGRAELRQGHQSPGN